MVDSFKEKLLSHYGLNEADFASFCLAPDISKIPTLEGCLEASKAKDIVLEAIGHNQKAIVYGDYDCDGVMATSIICHLFHLLKGSIASYLPSRYIDQYGLNMTNAEKIANNGYKLVILVDNGICCLDEIEYLKQRGIKVIVIDHHEPGATLPNADAILHPQTLPYGDYPVSAGYLSFLFSYLLLGYPEGRCLTMGALSTISDMMILKGHNREIVRLALQELHAHPSGNPIASLCSCPADEIDEGTLSMDVAPKINSIGRYIDDSKINRLAHFFGGELTPDQYQAYITWMEAINEERKELTKRAIDEASIDENEPAVFHIGTLKEGLNGILANRFLQNYNKPSLVCSPSSKESDLYVGSLRAKEGCSVLSFLEENESLFVRYGGHQLAAGVAFKKENAEAVKSALFAYASSHPFDDENADAIEIIPGEVSSENFALVRALGPYGFGFPRPEFILKDISTSSLSYSHSQLHMLTPLPKGGTILGFGYSRLYLSTFDYVDIYGTFAYAKDRDHCDFKVSAILESV